MNSKNSKTSDPKRLLLNLSDKIILKGNNKNVALLILRISYTWKSIKMSYQNNKCESKTRESFKLQRRMNIWIRWKKISDIHNYFEYITKKNGPVTDNLPVRIYVNKIENMITFKIKTWHYLEILTYEL